MCGFAGVIAWDERYRVSWETLAKMSAAIAHRGPDGEGMYFSPEGPITPGTPQVALAHRRLAIIDPDPRANQPFTDGQGRWLVFNGEIYNYRELKRELKQLKPDYEWRTDCDTEVLLVAYDVWGEKCVEHFNGMFAFAIWDGVKQELFLARDRMGQKPLYLACIRPNGQRTAPSTDSEREVAPVAIVFASEISGVMSFNQFPRVLGVSALTDYLQLGYLSGSETIWRGVERLDPSSSMRATGTTCDWYSYLPKNALPTEIEARSFSDDQAVRATRDLVMESVRRQLVADVPLGCFLSGGVDSSVIASSMLSVTSGSKITTYSIGFEDPRYDESDYARRVSDHLGTDHHQFMVRADAATDLPLIAKAFGEPFGDSSALPTHYLSRATRGHVKVALSGDGGDELFGGYDRYRAMRLAQSLRRTTTPLPWMILAPLARLLPATDGKSRMARARRFLSSVGENASRRYSGYVRIFDGDTICELLEPVRSKAKEWGPTHSDHLMRLWGHPNVQDWVEPSRRIRDDVRAAMAIDRRIYLPGDLLTKVDRASMLHALEVRSPFMDHELVQFAAGLTTDQLLKGGPKRMLREAFADDLPAWVFKRKKMGFAVPIGEWFRGELRPMLHDHLFGSNSFGSSHFNMAVVRRLVDEHESMRQDHSQRLYALLMLELWWNLQRKP